MIEHLEMELASINRSIRHLAEVLDDRSRFAKNEWVRNQMRIITMDIKELMGVRHDLLKQIKNAKVEGG